jgi:hypothetical protein
MSTTVIGRGQRLLTLENLVAILHQYKYVVQLVQYSEPGDHQCVRGRQDLIDEHEFQLMDGSQRPS